MENTCRSEEKRIDKKMIPLRHFARFFGLKNKKKTINRSLNDGWISATNPEQG